MGVSTIDGTLEEAVLKRVRRNIRIFERLTFRLRDGTTKSVAKAVVDAPVADRLVPGTSGRFYLYTAVDHRGVHGVRADDGQSVFGYPKNNEKIMLVMIPLLTVWILIGIAMIQDAPLLPTILLLLSIPFYFLYRSTRLQAQRQYEADSARAPSAPPLAAEPAVGA